MSFFFFYFLFQIKPLSGQFSCNYSLNPFFFFILILHIHNLFPNFVSVNGHSFQIFNRFMHFFFEFEILIKWFFNCDVLWTLRKRLWLIKRRIELRSVMILISCFRYIFGKNLILWIFIFDSIYIIFDISVIALWF